ncbi:hypothetical protein EDF81_2848 [Enterobacter sp. BIGb0383]|nr:hypothetical protein EDF81_2848 [Enterobacter sp. BIGb0383]ROS08509.1 hypothetical protein EC848_1987 [Enterobacter sp. BIGb0359]
MMNSRYRSFILLLYLCSTIFITLFIITMSFSLLGYWIGGGDNIFSFFSDKLFKYIKVGFSGGVLIGFILWFFYYRKF